jgi:hypothetical protein
MCSTVKELQEIIETENILRNCTGVCDAVARCCISFRESGRFPESISFRKIATLLSLDAMTIWNHWQQFQKFDLADVENERPTSLSDDQIRVLVDYAIAEFDVM